MIGSFNDRDTELIFDGYASKRLPRDMQNAARRKLRQLDAAEKLDELRIPPGNRLEALRGNRLGQFSIRVNQQWRICFNWQDGRAENVEICDYH
jgi:toxin HigB-1